jgi:hypothetical protein
MTKLATRVVPLLWLVMSACAGTAPPDPIFDEDEGDDDGGADDGTDDGDDGGDDGTESPACEMAWECSDACGQQAGCADTDDACWEQCDSQCNLEQACAGDPGDPGDPGGGDPAACDAAWQCSDDCGAQNQCGDDEACWEQCDAQCNLEEACAGEY